MSDIVEQAKKRQKEDLKKGKEDKPIYRANFPDLVDIVANDQEPKFLLASGELLDQVELDNIIILPPKKEKIGFTLPNYNNIISYYNKHNINNLTDVTDVTGPAELVTFCDEDEVLFDRLDDYHRQSAELPRENLYPLIVAWDFHTHLLEVFDYSPIIFFAGLPEKGKSRMARSVVAVSRRGVIRASITDAQIIREASEHQATLFFDMTDFAKSMDRAGSMDVVLSRYERGLKVARVKYPEKGAFEDMIYYDVFGPTIISSNETIDSILGSRTITIIMRQAKKDFKQNIDLKLGADLRDQLVAWRLAHYKDQLPEIEKTVPGRLGDIVRPLHQIILKVKPQLENDFIEAIKDIQKRRDISKSDTLEADIIQAIMGLENQLQNNLIPVKNITDLLNEEKTDREKVTYQMVGRRLDILGYQKARTGTGASAIMRDESLTEVLSVEHNITETLPATSETQ